MCLVIYAWLVQMDYFKELTDQDVRKRLYEEQKNQIEQDMAPFGFLNDGLGDDSFVDSEGDRWFTDEYLENNPNTYEKIVSILSANNMENFLKVYELFVVHKNDEDFEKIKAKTLIMTGEFDVGSTVKMSEELNKIIKDSRMKIINNGKHLCGIECADDVNLTIKDFIEKNE